jgi:hypothetical protein
MFVVHPLNEIGMIMITNFDCFHFVVCDVIETPLDRCEVVDPMIDIIRIGLLARFPRYVY